MPLIQVHLVKGKSPKYIKELCDGIHQALQTAWEIPHNDRFDKENWSFGNGVAQFLEPSMRP